MSLILKGFGQMTTQAIRTRAKAAFGIGVRLYSGINALYESLASTAAPGSQQKTIISHDHTPGTEGNNGIPIPRGTIYCMDNGTYDASFRNWEIVTTAPDIGSNISFIPWRTPNLKVLVSPGIDSSSLTAAAAPVALQARLFIQTDNTGIGQVFFQNTTKGGVSSLLSPAPGGGYQFINDIPCQGGAWNDLNVVLRVTGVGYIRILAMVIYESPTYSQPASAGTVAFSGATTRP